MNLANSGTCSSCGISFSFFKRRRQCDCCRRFMCENCLQRKEVGANAHTVHCPSCVLHCTRNDPRCISRLVPYFCENSDNRLVALSEFTELVSSAALSTEEVMGTGCVRGLYYCFVPKTPQNVVAAAAYLLNYLLTLEARGAQQVLENKAYVPALVAAAEKYGSEIAHLTRVLSKLAENAQGRAALEGTHKVLAVAMSGLRTLDIALAGSCVELIANMHAEDHQLPAAEQEKEYQLMPLIATFISQALATGKLDIADTAVHAVNTLCGREECINAFAEAEGTGALLNALASFAAAAAEDESKAEARMASCLNALFRMTRRTECCAKMMDSLDGVFSGCERIGEKSPKVRAKLLRILRKLALNPSTRGRLCAAIVEKHAATFAAIFKTHYAGTETLCMDIVVTILHNIRVGKWNSQTHIILFNPRII